jgi:hypothetical protein
MLGRRIRLAAILLCCSPEQRECLCGDFARTDPVLPVSKPRARVTAAIAVGRTQSVTFAGLRDTQDASGLSNRRWQDKSAGLRRAHVVGGTVDLGRRPSTPTGAFFRNANEFNDPTAVAGPCSHDNARR